MNIPGTFKFDSVAFPHFVTTANIGNFIGLQKMAVPDPDSIMLAKTISQFWKRPVIAMNLDHTSDVIQLGNKTSLDLLIPNIFARIAMKADGILTYHKTGKMFPCVIINFHADCINLVVCGKVVRGSIHVSRLNLLANDGIIQRTIALAKEMGEKPEDLSVGIFPGICMKCFDFEADSPIVADFLKVFPQGNLYDRKGDRIGVDFAQATKISLLAQGVKNIEILPFCSNCSRNGRSNLFHSYRRSLQTGEKDCRNATGILL